jgi:hypothetical protein
LTPDFLNRWAESISERFQASGGLFSRTQREKPTLVERLLENTFFQFVTFLIFIAALAAIITTGFDARGIVPDRDIIGEPAQYDIRATHDFTFTETDQDALQAKRAEAASAVPPVYDWQEGRGDELRDQITKAFEQMRTALAEAGRDWLGTNQSATLERIKEETPESMRQRALIDALPEDVRVSLAAELRADHFRTHLDGRLTDPNFEILAQFGFSATAENALSDILDQVLDRAIVANRDLPRIQTDRGVYLRRLQGDKLLIEYHVTNVDDRLVPMREVPSLVREAAPQSLSSIQADRYRSALISAAIALVQPNTQFNKAKTHEKRQAAEQAVASSSERLEFSKGQIIVDRGHIITERHYQIVKQMYEEDRYLTRIQAVAGTVLLALLLIVTVFAFGGQNIREFRPSIKDVFFTATNLLLFLLITQFFTSVFAPALAEQLGLGTRSGWYYLAPVAAGGMLVRLVLNNEHAVVYTIIFSVLAGVVAEQSLFFGAFTALGTLVGVGTVQQVKHRMALMWSGVAVGAINLSAVLAFLLIQGEFFQSTAVTAGTALIGLGGGLFAGAVVLALLPVYEAVFGYTTDIKLLELANLNHPLLRNLILRAPGSYHHSMMVGSLCEAAAEAIGANPLLARVGAYYHDIGKAKNPQYFAENQKPGENPHDKIKPNMSALIIKNHVKDGLEMARNHRLPQEMHEFIAQHHGTSLISYFYHRAKEMEDPDIPEVTEEDYRYPGPKPQTRETAICLLADGIEAASRSMENPTPDRLKGLVQKMINKAFTDGQLDECDLTLRDLNKIARALTRILTGIFHHRPKYPGQSEERRDRSAQANATPEVQADEEAEGNGGADGTDDQEETEDDADRTADDGNGDGSSEEGDGSEEDQDEGRESLPRLGT